MVDIIMQGFQRVNKVSSFNLDPDSTPFGTMEEVRGEVSSVLEEVAKLGRLPVVTFSAGGISTPADAALMMKHGMDGILLAQEFQELRSNTDRRSNSSSDPSL